MSTDDRSTIYQKPCPCGKGELIIILCEPDHPWATMSKSYETLISCEICSSKYSLIEQENHFVLVKKSEVKRRELYYDEYNSRGNDLLNLPNVIKLKQELIGLIESQKSIAAIYRL